MTLAPASPRALFLDRDGVINVDTAYVHTPEAFVFIDGIFDLCRAAVRAGWLVIVVTNQAGIGRGYYTETQFQALWRWMRERFAEQGAPLAEIYHCPYHPEFGLGAYRAESPDRKPEPGMLLRAQKCYKLDLANSIIVGDSAKDMEAGRRAGVGLRLLFDPCGKTARQEVAASARLTDLRQAIGYLTAPQV